MELINFDDDNIRGVIKILLADRNNPKHSILLATSEYAPLGENEELTDFLLENSLKDKIQPRVLKNNTIQKSRTKSKAEVFTPSWLCNEMNNYCDDDWFGRKNVFNTMSNHDWTASAGKISIPKDKTWKEYVDLKKIEITCGEAPFIVSRYDTTTGDLIPVSKRIGFLDRKLRIVNEQAADYDEWLLWVYRAFQACYGYEWQGDNLLIARINLVLTFVDNKGKRWGLDPTKEELENIATIVSKNLWQMNGLTWESIWNRKEEETLLQKRRRSNEEMRTNISGIVTDKPLELEDIAMIAYYSGDIDKKFYPEGDLEEALAQKKYIKTVPKLSRLMVPLFGFGDVEGTRKALDKLKTLLERCEAETKALSEYKFHEIGKCGLYRWDRNTKKPMDGRWVSNEEVKMRMEDKKRKPLFDYAVFNPPYQETKGNTKNIDIWPGFISAACDVSNVVCAIHPGRWVVPKKNMLSVRETLISNGLFLFNYYPSAEKVFNNVSIDGGVTETLFKRDHTGNIEYALESEKRGVYKKEKMFFSDLFEEEAYIKMKEVCSPFVSIEKRIIGNAGSLAGREFGYYKSKNITDLKDTPEGMKEPVLIWANAGFGRGLRFGWHYIEKSSLSDFPDILFSTRKVMIDKKGNSLTHGKGNVINNIPQIVDKNVTASGDVFFVIPQNDTDHDLKLIQSYFMTKTVRFLLSITQKDLYVRGFENVPDYITVAALLGCDWFTDKDLYQLFGYSDNLIMHIESRVSKKELSEAD